MRTHPGKRYATSLIRLSSPCGQPVFLRVVPGVAIVGSFIPSTSATTTSASGFVPSVIPPLFLHRCDGVIPIDASTGRKGDVRQLCLARRRGVLAMSAAGLSLGTESEGLGGVSVAEAENRKRAEAMRRRVPAYALIRAMATGDQDAALLVVQQAADAGSLDLLAFNMAKVAADALLASEGWDLAKVLGALDYWSEQAAKRPSALGKAAALSLPARFPSPNVQRLPRRARTRFFARQAADRLCLPRGRDGQDDAESRKRAMGSTTACHVRTCL